MEPSSVYNVIINQNDVMIQKVKPKQRGYAQAKRSVILRERDAIELFQRLKAEGQEFEGTYSFQFLETAKTFAMLRLKTIGDEIENCLDRVQVYDGEAPSTAA